MDAQAGKNTCVVVSDESPEEFPIYVDPESPSGATQATAADGVSGSHAVQEDWTTYKWQWLDGTIWKDYTEDANYWIFQAWWNSANEPKTKNPIQVTDTRSYYFDFRKPQDVRQLG